MTFKVKDHYFHKAKKENFLARSIYKLEEIDQKFKVINKNDQVIDLGYYPGSWVQYTSQKVGPEGHIVGVDIKVVNPVFSKLLNVKLYQQDVFQIHDLESVGVSKLFDVVLSDMAPNTTGIRSVDQDRSLGLVEKVFELIPRILKPHGNLVIKVFESQSAQDFLKSQKNLFEELHFLRPKSVRSVSKEYFVIGKKYKKS